MRVFVCDVDVAWSHTGKDVPGVFVNVIAPSEAAAERYARKHYSHTNIRVGSIRVRSADFRKDRAFYDFEEEAEWHVVDENGDWMARLDVMQVKEEPEQGSTTMGG